MELSGAHTFPAPQAVMWQVLTDPAVLRRCLPGCQAFDLQPDGGYQVVMTIGIAAIKGTYSGTVHMENVQPPDSYRLRVSAKGAAGFVSGHGDFHLAPDDKNPAHTRLTYTGHAQVGGKIAGVGQRLIGAGAQMVIGQFFKAMEKEAAQHQSNPAATSGG
jgi:carbon monoxide dehydrogenase subunit G